MVQQALESFPQSRFKVQEFAQKLETQKVGNETQRVENVKYEKSKISDIYNPKRALVSDNFFVEINISNLISLAHLRRQNCFKWSAIKAD